MLRARVAFGAVVLVSAAFSADESACGCPHGFPTLPVEGFAKISGNAGCIVNYLQFTAPNGTVVFTSGSKASGGQPFSVSCPAGSTIAGFSYLCNTNSAYPTPKFASLATLGGVTCSNASAQPQYTGVLNGNVCELSDGYTQVAYLDCGADGSAPQSCTTEGGACVAGSGSHVTCAGTQACQVIPPPPPPRTGPWPMMYSDSAHTSMGPARGPTVPSVLWSYGLPYHYGLAVGFSDTGDDVIFATTDGATPPAGGINAITRDGKPAWQWVNPDGGYMDCTPVVGANGTIFVGETNFHAIDILASQLWDVPLNPAGPYASSATGGPDGSVYFTTSSFQMQTFAYAIWPNGTVRWTVATGLVDANTHSPPALSLDGAAVYFPWNGQLHALDAGTGEQLWVATLGTDHEQCHPSVGPDGTVYCGTIAFAPSGGEQLWVIQPDQPSFALYAAPADSGKLYALGSDNNTYCLDAADGSVVWTAPTGAGGAQAMNLVLDSGNSVYVHAGNNVVALARSTGEMQWNITLPGAGTSISPPGSSGAGMLSDGTLIFASTAANSYVYAIGEAA